MIEIKSILLILEAYEGSHVHSYLESGDDQLFRRRISTLTELAGKSSTTVVPSN